MEFIDCILSKRLKDVVCVTIVKDIIHALLRSSSRFENDRRLQIRTGLVLDRVNPVLRQYAKIDKACEKILKLDI